MAAIVNNTDQTRSPDSAVLTTSPGISTSWFSGGILSSLFGYSIAQTNPIPGAELRTKMQQAASSKFNVEQAPILPQNIALPPTSSTSVTQASSVKLIPARTPLIDYLQSEQGISIGKIIGQGNFGKVYTAKIGSQDYVYKEQIKDEFLTDDEELNEKWWRTGDIAASRCKDLSHFAKSAAFVLEITKPNSPVERYYVPADQTKDFGKKLPEETKVKLVAQLMEKAVGTELEELLKDPNFKPVEHFDGISRSLFGFLEKAYARNLIHRDLKAENFIYDPATKQGTIIDFGLGGVYGARHKMKPGLERTQKSNNLLLSSTRWGTPNHMAPAVANSELYGAKPYGSEVDFHSAAVMLIKSLSPQDFETAKKSFFTQVKNHYGKMQNGKIIPSKIPISTADYLQILGSNSELARTLQANPEIKTTIDLFFAVASATPEKRDEAFLALKDRMNPALKSPSKEQLMEEAPPFYSNILDPISEKSFDPHGDDLTDVNIH